MSGVAKWSCVFTHSPRLGKRQDPCARDTEAWEGVVSQG